MSSDARRSPYKRKFHHFDLLWICSTTACDQHHKHGPTSPTTCCGFVVELFVVQLVVQQIHNKSK